MDKHPRGDTFVREKTGSATKINLDGQWERDFVDDETPAGEKNKVAGDKKPSGRRKGT